MQGRPTVRLGGRGEVVEVTRAAVYGLDSGDGV